MQMATSPKELAEVVDVILAMLADPAAALAVALGPAGAVAGLSKGGCTSLLVASKLIIQSKVWVVDSKYVLDVS